MLEVLAAASESGKRSPRLRKKPAQKRAPASRRAVAAPDPNDRLAEALRDFRKAEAKKRGVPPFIVFNDRDLAALVEASPRTEDDLMRVAGFGAKKVKQLGPRLLDVVRSARG